MFRRIAWLLCILACSPAIAQTLEFSLTADSQLRFKPAFRIENLTAQDLRFDLRLAGGIAGPLELGLSGRSTTILGPLGTIILEGSADAELAGNFDVQLAGRGVIGAVAGRVRLYVFNALPGEFDLAQAFAAVRPRRLPGNVTLAGGLGITYRLERTTILVLDPDVYWTSGTGFGARLEGALELRQLVDRDDGRILFLADLHAGRGYAAAGFEYRVDRRDWPLLGTSLWLGGGSEGLWPGGRLAISGELEELNYSLDLAAEPYRTDALKYRTSAGLGGEVGPGTLSTTVFATLDDDPFIDRVALRTAYRVSF